MLVKINSAEEKFLASIEQIKGVYKSKTAAGAVHQLIIQYPELCDNLSENVREITEKQRRIYELEEKLEEITTALKVLTNLVPKNTI